MHKDICSPKDGNLIRGGIPNLQQPRAPASYNMAFRDAKVVIIEVARTTVRAGIGLHDLLTKPTIVGVIEDYISSV